MCALTGKSSISILIDPWFWQFPMATLAISMAAFLLVAIPWTLVAW
ncbi:hypothetical protein [Psychrobacter immobilis]|nr:hypothetical protein [Psychrobacter immobilis]